MAPMKLIFRQDDMRLLGVHVVGEQATELVHLGLIAIMAEAGADLFNRTCFNYPTLGDLYKYATYESCVRAIRLPLRKLFPIAAVAGRAGNWFGELGR